MKKQCKSCGNENDEDMKFCTNCGGKLEEIKEAPKPKVEQPISQPPPSTVTPKQPKSFDKILLPLIIIAFILSIVAITLPLIMDGEALSSESVGTTELADSAVTSTKIADRTIVDNDISNIGISKIAALAVDSDNIIGGAVDMSHLSTEVSDAITGAGDIADNSITSEKIKDFTVNSADIKNNSITSVKIPADAVGSSEIAAGAVGTSEIENEAVDTEDIADDAVTYDKLDIKIKYGVKTGAINGTLISHGIGAEPTSVILTPIYEEGNLIIHANVYDVDDDSFRIGLWTETISTSIITEVTGGGVDVYWTAIV
jgi:hypothetical protein